MSRVPTVPLESLQSDSLPSLCNVHVRLADRPFRVQADSPTDRWHLPVRGLSGSSKPALVSVHYEPTTAAVKLPYGETARGLLRLFEDPTLSALLEPGETALVQAVPRWGHRDDQSALFLNVQAILLLHPSLLVGRNLTDWSHACPRKTYLSYTKGASQRVHSTHWGSIGGVAAHEVIEYVACEGDVALKHHPDEVFLAGVTSQSLQRLVSLALVGNSDAMRSATRMGLNAIGTLLRDSALSNFLTSGKRWEAESLSLNNGVDATPDLLRDGEVVDLKYINPEGRNFDQRKFARQVESYLAWAMVEFGVPTVCREWQGHVVHLHQRISPEQRIVSIAANLDMIGRRIQNRHRIVGLAMGSWLPQIGAECSACEFSKPTGAQPQCLPAACQYYCQTERCWDCIDQSGSGVSHCRLLDHCDVYDQYEPYERLDLFSHLRRELLEEAEEQAGIEALLRSLSEESLSGWHLLGFEVHSQQGGLLRLKIPDALRTFGAFATGTTFELESAPTDKSQFQSIGRVRLVRRSRDVLIFHAERVTSLLPGQTVRLRQCIRSRYPVRKQLQFLDLLQRQGREPPSLRGGRAPTASLSVREHSVIGHVPDDAELVLVDQPNRRRAFETADALIRAHNGKSTLVVLGGDGLETRKSSHVADVTPEAIGADVRAESGPLLDRLERVASRLRAKRAFFVSPEDLYDGVLGDWKGSIDTLVVPDADRFSLLGVQQCLDLAPRRLYLIGQSLSAGPRTLSSGAQEGVLHQNPLQFLIEVGAHALPSKLLQLDLVRPVEVTIAEGVSHPQLDQRRGRETPCDRVIVPSEGTGDMGDTPLRLTQKVRGTVGHRKRCRITLGATSGLQVSAARLRTLLKGVTGESLEGLSKTLEGKLDASILGIPFQVLSVERFPVDCDPEHELEAVVPRTTLRAISMHSRTSQVEARVLLAEAKACESPVAVSPFHAQCLLISRLAAEEGVDLRVFTCEEFGIRRTEHTTVLLSMVAEQDEMDGSFPYPLSDIPLLLPIFLADCERIRVLCSPSVAAHHPLIRGVKDKLDR